MVYHWKDIESILLEVMDLNELEKEIDTYDQVIFPPRPAGLEGDREEVMAERKRQRREREREKFNTPILRNVKAKHYEL
jgi:hypothetical protein